MKKALITGVAGQDGSYLSEFLLNKGYEVHGTIRRSSLEDISRIDHLYKGESKNNNFHVHYGDVTDSLCMGNIISKVKPDEIYHLAAQSHVRVSFDIPGYTAQTDAIGTLNILESIRQNNLTKKTKFYQASTSELFGKVESPVQNEKTAFYPRSPYGTAKLYAYWTTINYREAYGIFACNGILFNHESPRRGNSFVSKKIAETVAKISKNKNIVLKLGNLNAHRDWGYAAEYVEAMWKMLQLKKPYDLVISTGETHSVRDFVNLAFKKIGRQIIWKGEGLEEKGFCAKSNSLLVKIDPYYFRPTEVDLLRGDSSLAKEIIKWEPKVTFSALVDLMMDYEISKL
ncbi:MAG: GDP-mannose 4,6-dehydratase [Flavobacteriaceae bacterium]|jgi:GDPmannose 4,6-dehydratase|nr:GDP-mannose 4,6-dehydratase [Flavobacteriaceae bacterium]MBT6170240.1 GDP-mannose 4,6-dehydratase [Flavobacteriaceae bacterium]